MRTDPRFAVPTPSGTVQFRQKRNKFGRLKWRWWVEANNGEIIALCPPTGYYNLGDCTAGAALSGEILADDQLKVR